MAAFGHRLESLLELMAQLIAIIKPPANSLLPVLRIAAQALTLQQHDLLQLKATGRISQLSPGIRPSGSNGKHAQSATGTCLVSLMAPSVNRRKAMYSLLLR